MSLRVVDRGAAPRNDAGGQAHDTPSGGPTQAPWSAERASAWATSALACSTCMAKRSSLELVRAPDGTAVEVRLPLAFRRRRGDRGSAARRVPQMSVPTGSAGPRRRRRAAGPPPPPRAAEPPPRGRPHRGGRRRRRRARGPAPRRYRPGVPRRPDAGPRRSRGRARHWRRPTAGGGLRHRLRPVRRHRVRTRRRRLPAQALRRRALRRGLRARPPPPRRRSLATVRARLAALLGGAGTLPASAGHITVEKAGRLAVLPLAEVDWLRAAGNYVQLHARGETYLVRSTLARAADRFPVPALPAHPPRRPRQRRLHRPHRGDGDGRALRGLAGRHAAARCRAATAGACPRWRGERSESGAPAWC